MDNESSHGRSQASMGNNAPSTSHETMPQPAPGPSEPISPATGADNPGLRMKAVLLVDLNRKSRESRAKVMRARGVRVDCAADFGAARVRLVADRYNLVLVDPGRERESAEALVKEIRTSNSRQLVGFLVGSPRFVVKSLSTGASRPRPPVMPPAIDAGSGTPTAGSTDFGPRIRDAEAENKK